MFNVWRKRLLSHFEGSVQVGLASYPITHLAPFYYTFKGMGDAGADIRMRVSFSCHVFSEKPENNDAGDFKDHNGKLRSFDSQRYTLSLTLPNLLENMLANNFFSWEMRDHNGFANMAALTDPTVKDVTGKQNVVLYYLYPANAGGFDVEMNVLSCHYRPVNSTKHRKTPINILTKTCYFKKVKVPKN